MTGHSLLPPDRVYENIEKDIKHHKVIVSPEEYIMINNFAKVKCLKEGITNKNWKESADQTMKKPGSWHLDPSMQNNVLH